MKKILLLGGSSQQIIAIKKAKKLGLYTILCDYLPNNPGQHYADKYYQVSTTDKEEVLKIGIDEKIDYIISYASDPAAPTAAYVAEIMGLPTNPYNAVKTLCNKDSFRKFLTAHGFNSPRAKGYNKKEDILSEIDGYEFPLIIKPVDSSGSKGATVIQDLRKLDNAVDFAFSYSRCNRIIIEEYIEKKHRFLIGGDIFVSDGKVILWGLMNCHRDSRVNPLVPVGKSFPPFLDKSDLNRVKTTLQKLIDSLGIKFGSMNVELVIDKKNRVYPIDIGPRSGGNMIPDLLGIIFNCDIVEMNIRATMGQKIETNIGSGEPFYASLNLHSNREGLYKSVCYRPEIKKYIIYENIYKKPGDKISYFSNASNAIGIVFFKFPDQRTLFEMMEKMNDYVEILFF